MARITACLILAAFALGASAASAQERPMSKPQAPATQGDPTPPTGTPIAPERAAPDSSIRQNAAPDAGSPASVAKDTSTEAPGGQAESSHNGSLSTTAPAEARPPLVPEQNSHPPQEQGGPPN